MLATARTAFAWKCTTDPLIYRIMLEFRQNVSLLVCPNEGVTSLVVAVLCCDIRIIFET